jgi:hypothetical protein
MLSHLLNWFTECSLPFFLISLCMKLAAMNGSVGVDEEAEGLAAGATGL